MIMVLMWKLFQLFDVGRYDNVRETEERKKKRFIDCKHVKVREYF